MKDICAFIITIACVTQCCMVGNIMGDVKDIAIQMELDNQKHIKDTIMVDTTKTVILYENDYTSILENEVDCNIY